MIEVLLLVAVFLVAVIMSSRFFSVFYWYFIFNACSLLFVVAIFYGVLVYEDYVGMPFSYEVSEQAYRMIFFYVVFSIACMFVVECFYPSRKVKLMTVDVGRVVSNISDLYLKVGSLIAVLICVVHFFDLNKSVFWKNDAYLYLVSPSLAGMSNPLTSIIHSASGLLGVALGFLLVVCKSRNIKIAWIVLCLCFFYVLLLKTAQFSRWSPLMFLGWFGALLIFDNSKKRSKLFVFFIVYIALSLFLLSLAGRHNSSQGVSAIPSVFFRIMFDFDLIFNFVSLMVSNIFGGFIVFTQAFELDVSYTELYKILSFSPFPSAIDGYDSVFHEVVFVNRYVPFSGFSEIHFFGLGYFIFWCLFLCIVQMYMNFLSRCGAVLEYNFLMLCFVISIFMFSFYPVRNSLRFFLFPLLIVFFVRFFYWVFVSYLKRF